MIVGKFILAGVFMLILSACQTVGGVIGSQSRVAIIDPGSRAHLQTELTMGDYIAFSEKVTNKMMSSKFVQGWGKKRPKLIVGTLQNNTDNENIRMRDLHDRIQETIFNSSLVRIVDKSATSFDYVVRTELTSTRQYGEKGEELVYFTMQLKMFKLDGELMGQWSDDLPLAKAGKTLF